MRAGVGTPDPFVVTAKIAGWVKLVCNSVCECCRGLCGSLVGDVIGSICFTAMNLTEASWEG